MLLRLRNSLASMTGMIRRQETLANNLANVNTAGYKRDRLFSTALEEAVDAEGSPESTRQIEQWADHAQGSLQATGRPLDIAINGEGFFVVQDEEGNDRYTRAGSFSLDADGTVRSHDGYALQGESGPISIPLDAAVIDISRSGEVMAGNQEVGKIRVVAFEDPSDMKRLDGAAFESSGATPPTVESATLVQGFIEASNVNAVEEMTRMITHQQLFDSQQRALRTQDQILGTVTRELGRF